MFLGLALDLLILSRWGYKKACPMPGKPTYTPAELAYQIEIYLSRNPDAADTLEGVTRWWLQDLPGRICRQDVVTALKLLEDQKEIRTYLVPGSNRIYENCNRIRH